MKAQITFGKEVEKFIKMNPGYSTADIREHFGSESRYTRVVLERLIGRGVLRRRKKSPEPYKYWFVKWDTSKVGRPKSKN